MIADFSPTPICPAQYFLPGEAAPGLICGRIATPFGSGFAAFAGRACAALGFGAQAEQMLGDQLAGMLPRARLHQAPDRTQRLADGIFSARPAEVFLVGTRFRQKIWQTLLRLPAGKTCSYKELALAAGLSSHASRAVGQALANNPVSYLVPCHRVLSHEGKLHHYRWGLPVKRALLHAEQAG